MKQENMNNKMEQNSKENEVTKNEVAETEAMPCNATNTATANTTTLQRTITVPSNAITIQSFASQFFESGGTLVESGTAIAGRKDNLYHYAICSINLQEATNLANALNENKKVLLKIDAAHYEGLDVCVFLTQTQTLFTWEDGREIAFEINDAYSNGSIMFIVAPATPQSNGYITFGEEDMTLSDVLHYSIQDITYVSNSNNEKHTMDIHFRYDLEHGDELPAVITIHGGGWCGGERGYYNYMTEFITNSLENNGCNCVHVNMDYRLTTGTPGGNDITYEDMLEDTQSAIGYLTEHASTYHINPEKIALMGHSAGGHLALLYAYMAKQGYYNYGNNIQLVISEAGPTYFTTDLLTGLQPIPQGEIMSMAGTTMNDFELATKLTNASPCTYANGVLPFTIYARGAGDNIINVDQVLSLAEKLVSDDIANAEGTSLQSKLENNQLTGGENYDCAFFTFPRLGHDNFGATGSTGMIHPGVESNPTDNEQQSYKPIVINYYDKISSILQELMQQE